MNNQANTKDTHNKRARRAVCYLRVARSSHTSDAIARQRAACEQLARNLGLEVVDVYIDIGSGANAERPGLTYLLADLERRGGVDVILAYDLSRISRDRGLLHRILAKLDTYGVHVKTVKASGVLDVMSSLDTFMAEAIRQERSARAKQGWVKRRQRRARRPQERQDAND